MSIVYYTHAFEASAETEKWDLFFEKIGDQCPLTFKEQSWDDLKSGDQTGLVIVSGGDGSLNGAVTKICENQVNDKVKLLYLPAGTGNDFARTAALDETDRSDLLKLIQEESLQSVWVAKMDDQYFVNMATAGRFAEITPEVSKETKAMLGRWAYYLKGLQSIPEITPYDCRFRVDGGEWQQRSAVGFFIANAPYAGGGVRVAPTAQPFEQNLDLLIIDERPLSELISFGIELQKESPNLDGFSMEMAKVSNVEFECTSEMTVNLDGESSKIKNASFQTTNLQIKMFMPRV